MLGFDTDAPRALGALTPATGVWVRPSAARLARRATARGRS